MSVFIHVVRSFLLWIFVSSDLSLFLYFVRYVCLSLVRPFLISLLCSLFMFCFVCAYDVARYLFISSPLCFFISFGLSLVRSLFSDVCIYLLRSFLRSFVLYLFRSLFLYLVRCLFRYVLLVLVRVFFSCS